MSQRELTLLNAAFELPPGRYHLPAEIVGLIDVDWGWVTGRLDAPPDLLASGEASSHTGFVLDFHRGLRVETLRRRRGNANFEEHEDLEQRRYGLVDLATSRRPAFVAFYEAGQHGGADMDLGLTPWWVIRRIVDTYVTCGYTGDLTLNRFNERDPDELSHPSAKIEIHLAPFRERSPRPEDQPKRETELTYQELVDQAGEMVRRDGVAVEDAIRALGPPKPVYREHQPCIVLTAVTEDGAEDLHQIAEWLGMAGLKPIDPDIGYGHSHREYRD